MKELKKWLMALLALQICLVVALYYTAYDTTDFDDQQRLLEADIAVIDKLQIDDGETTAVLQKADDEWLLPEYANLPSDSSKVTEALEKLLDTKRGWPVAATAGSQQRFEVSEDQFQRKVSLFSGDNTVGELYLGTSPGYRNVHARVAGEDDIFSVRLASFDFPADNQDWFDTALLALEDPRKIKGADFELVRKEDKWTMAVSPVLDQSAPDIDGDKADGLSALFKNMRVESLAEAELSTPDTTLEIVVSGDDQAWTYRFFALDDKHYVRRMDKEVTFVIDESDFEKVAQANLEYLALKEEESSEVSENIDLSSNEGK